MKVYLTFNNIRDNELSLIERSEAILGELGFSFKKNYNEESKTRTWEMIPSKRNPMMFMFTFSTDEMMEINNTPFSEISSVENPPLSIDLNTKKPIGIKQLKKIFPKEIIDNVEDLKDLLKISNTFRQINMVLIDASKIEDPAVLKSKENEIRKCVIEIKKLLLKFKNNEQLFKILKELWLNNMIQKDDIIFTGKSIANKKEDKKIKEELNELDFSDDEINSENIDDEEEYLTEEEIEERRRITLKKIKKAKKIENKFYRLSFIVRAILEYIEDQEMSEIIMDVMTFDDDEDEDNDDEEDGDDE